MMAAGQWRIVAGGAVLALVVAGCTLQPDAPGRAASSGGFGSASGGSASSSGGSAEQPMVVEVDPNQKMTAQPGNGVGVFTEYVSGGHWHVWWTCDTNATALPCAFDVAISAAGNQIANAASDGFSTSDRVTASGSTLEGATRTTTSIQGLEFDTAAGASITVDAKINGQSEAAILFFVQDGQVNGGYQGALTDPLTFEPTAP